MDFIIKPLEWVNDIKFGMTSEEIQSMLKMTPICKFNKTNIDGEITEDFGFLHIFYDADGRSKAFELFGEARVFLDGFQIMDEQYSKVEEYFKNIDDLFETTAGFVSFKYQLGVYCPFVGRIDPAQCKIESVCIGPSGYYDIFKKSVNLVPPIDVSARAKCRGTAQVA